VLVSTDENENVVLDCENGEPFGPRRALLGTMEDGVPNPLPWMAPITENPSLNSVEDWAFHNFTMDAHPIHLHQVMFQVIGRAPIGEAEEINPEEFSLPEPWETGWKDTVIAYPDQITYVRAKFDLPGLYVWHCHILNHEDNEMMRPYYVGSMPQGQLAP
jgi:FtsP/CotA-like multicopper oxidase with cupredoxin domain